MRLITALFAALLAFTPLVAPAAETPAHESAYDRVMRTGTLRCGYIPYSYLFQIDPNSGAKSGVMFDITNEIGRLMNLKVEWAEELTWATVATSIQTGRVDALCSGIWIDTQNGRVVAFTQPLYYNGISVYGRADENRFATLAALNDPAVRVIARDGGTAGQIARNDFPKATIVSVPSGISDGEMLAYILTNKADVIFYGDDYLLGYIAQNPGSLKAIFPDKLRTNAVAIALPITDFPLKQLFDNAITELKGGSFINTAVAKAMPVGSWTTSELP